MQSYLVSNQLQREIYVSDQVSVVKHPICCKDSKRGLFSDQVEVVKYPPVAKTINVDTTFLDCSTVQTLQRTHFRIGSCGTGESA